MSGLHCPNLIEEDAIFEASESEETADLPADLGVPVHIRWRNYSRHFTSLVDVWNSWYREYYEATFPRLIIRFEDMLFHPEDVVEAIRDCVNGSWFQDEYIYYTTPIKTAEYFREFLKRFRGLVASLLSLTLLP